MRRRDLPPATGAESGADERAAPPAMDDRYVKWLALLWIIASTAAVVNVVLFVRMTPVEAKWDSWKKTTTVAVSRWITRLPARTRFCSSIPDPPGWAYWRIPVRRRRLPRLPSARAVALVTLAGVASQRRCEIVAFGDAWTSIPGDWESTRHGPFVALARKLNAAPLGPHMLTTPAPTIPVLLGIVGAVASLVAVYLMGAMLLACTLPRAPFETWPRKRRSGAPDWSGGLTWIETMWMMATGSVSPLPCTWLWWPSSCGIGLSEVVGS